MSLFFIQDLYVLHSPETPLPGSVELQRLIYIGVGHIRPEGIAEVDLRVSRLPQQEIGQSLFASGSDDEIHVRLTGGIKRAGDIILGDGTVLVTQKLEGAGQLASGAVIDGYIELILELLALGLPSP